MNCRERFFAALRMETPDRVPVFYQQLGGARHVLDAAKTSMRDGYHDPEAFARIMMKAHELFGYDNVMIGWGDLFTEAQAIGTKWKFPEKDYQPRVEEYAVKEPADADKLVPVDPANDRFWSVLLKAGGILQERIGKEVAVVGSVVSPFFVATELRGYENLMMDTFTDPELVHRLVKVAFESEKIYGERIAALGLEAAYIDDSSASGQMVDPVMCETFDLSYLRSLLDHYRSLGILGIVHNDAQKPYVDEQIAAGAACAHFTVDYVDFPEIVGKHRGKVCLMPGINHQVVIFQKTPQDVEAKVREVIDAYGKHPGLIMAPGGEIPFKSPLENIVMVRQACENFGRY